MYLSVDIGGTKTLIALFSAHGRVIKKIKFATALQYDDFVEDLTSKLLEFGERNIKAVTVAIPGVVQKNCSAILGNRTWGKVNLFKHIKKIFTCPIYFENDANLAALYEGHRLRGKIVFLTFSTGIGGGVVENNEILPESDGFEPGHIEYEYGGKKQEWEDIAAASALEKHFKAKQATDLRGEEVMHEVAGRIAMGLPFIVSNYHPNTIILGGPLGKIFKLYVKYLPKFKDLRYRRPRRPTESVIYGGYIYGKNGGRKDH